jgi:AbiU2
MQREAKEILTEFIEKMSDVVSRLDSHFTMLKDLHSEANSSRGAILEYAPLFFSNISDAFKRTSVIEIYNLFGKSKNDQTSLRIMLKLICEYIKEHGDYDPDTTKIDRFIVESTEKINNLNDKLKIIKNYRDQVWGHRDMDYLKDSRGYFEKYPLNISEFEEFLLVAKEILQEAIFLFKGIKDREMEIPGSDGVISLIRYLIEHQEYRNQAAREYFKSVGIKGEE